MKNPENIEVGSLSYPFSMNMVMSVMLTYLVVVLVYVQPLSSVMPRTALDVDARLYILEVNPLMMTSP